MKIKLTILNISTLLFLLGALIFTIIRYPVLAKGEGWGIVFMIGLASFAATALIVDLAIQRLIKDRYYQNLAGVLVIVIYSLLLYFGT